MTAPSFERFHGVDFSGAKRAGDFIWVAELEPHRGRFVLTDLRSLTTVCGTADRAVALPALVALVRASERSLWGFDFPFGLPLELFPVGHRWPDVFTFAGEFDDAYECGMTCVRRARALTTHPVRKTAHHIRRLTDVEAKAPFDTFHYRMLFLPDFQPLFQHSEALRTFRLALLRYDPLTPSGDPTWPVVPASGCVRERPGITRRLTASSSVSPRTRRRPSGCSTS